MNKSQAKKQFTIIKSIEDLGNRIAINIQNRIKGFAKIQNKIDAKLKIVKDLIS